MPGCVASRMGLELGTRRMVTKEMKGRYERGSRQYRSASLDELCALTRLAPAHGLALRACSHFSTPSRLQDDRV